MADTTTPTIVHPIDMESLVLRSGAHSSGVPEAKAAEQQWCVMEAVSYLAGEPWSDRPRCACPSITAFLVRWNDGAWESDEARAAALGRYLTTADKGGVVGTRSTQQVQRRRAWMATDWAVRVSAPMWLRAAGMDEQAERLEALPELTEYSPETRALLATVREEAWAVRSARWVPYRDAFVEAFKREWEKRAGACQVFCVGSSWLGGQIRPASRSG